MNNILFTIIIPTLNEENYISGILNSLKDQTKKDFEVIIVDNGSTDKTVKIIEKFKKKSPFLVKIVFCKKRGISYARNFGVKFAKGEYLVFFDADGEIHKSWIVNAIKILKINPDIKVIGGPVIYKAPNLCKYILFNSYVFVIISGIFILNKTFNTGYHFCGNNMLVEKSLFKKLGGFPHIVGEDVAFTKKILHTVKNRNKLLLSLNLKAYYSSRRFEGKGFFKTLFGWAKDFKNKKNSSLYDLYR